MYTPEIEDKNEARKKRKIYDFKETLQGYHCPQILNIRGGIVSDFR